MKTKYIQVNIAKRAAHPLGEAVGSAWRPRPGSIFHDLDDEHKRKCVMVLKYCRNQRTCNICGRQWHPKDDTGKCPSCGSTSYRQRIKPNDSDQGRRASDSKQP